MHFGVRKGRSFAEIVDDADDERGILWRGCKESIGDMNVSVLAEECFMVRTVLRVDELEKDFGLPFCGVVAEYANVTETDSEGGLAFDDDGRRDGVGIGWSCGDFFRGETFDGRAFGGGEGGFYWSPVRISAETVAGG